MILAEKDYRLVLKEEFSRRLQLRRPYSMNAFAREIGLSSARLSEVLQGKQGLSRKVAEKIAGRIDLGGEEAEAFCDLVDMEHARSREQRDQARARVEERWLDRDYRSVQQDVFSAISDWYHFALLRLLETRRFRESPEWIARSLSITPMEAQLAIDRLLRLGLLERDSGGKLRPSSDFVSTTDGVPSQAIRSFHAQVLRKALSALEEQGVERRNFSANILAVQRADLPKAKEALRRFRRRFTKDYARPGRADSVYCLSVQLFDLTQERSSS